MEIDESYNKLKEKYKQAQIEFSFEIQSLNRKNIQLLAENISIKKIS